MRVPPQAGAQPACDDGCAGSARSAACGARDRRAGYRADSATHDGADRSCDHGARAGADGRAADALLDGVAAGAEHEGGSDEGKGGEAHGRFLRLSSHGGRVSLVKAVPVGLLQGNDGDRSCGPRKNPYTAGIASVAPLHGR